MTTICHSTSVPTTVTGLLAVALVILLSPMASAQEAGGDVTGKPVTLDELLEYAHDHAPEILSARERVARGEAAIEGASVYPFNPEVEGSLDLGLDDVGVSRFETTLKQRVEIAGQRGLRVEAAEQFEESLQAEVEAAEWDLHERIHALYRLGLIDQKRVDVETQIRDFTGELVRVARERYEAGEEARTSVIVTRAERARARQRLVQSRVQLTATLRRLAEVSGWEEKTPPLPTGELPGTRDVPPADELVERAWRHDPRTVVLQRRLEAAEHRVTAAEREAWPDPLFGVGYERERIGTAEPENKLIFLIGLPLPFFQRNQGAVADAQADVAVLRQALRNRKTVLRNRVRTQVAAVEGAAAQARIFEEEVLPSFEEQLDLLQEGFKLGEMDLLDVMTARDRLLEAQRDALDAQQRYVEAIGDLEALLGTSIWAGRE